MKTILLAAVLIIGYTMTVYAQSPAFADPDSGTGKLKLGKPGISALNDSLTKGKLDVPFSTNNLYFQDPKDKEVKMGMPAAGNYRTQGGMPVYKPRGSFSMPVVKPDSSIHFFMKIKEYKKLAPTDFR